MRVRAREGFFFCLRASALAMMEKCGAQRRKPNGARIFFYEKEIAGVDGCAEKTFHRAERGFLRDMLARERRMDVRVGVSRARFFCTFFSSPGLSFGACFFSARFRLTT